MKAKLRQRCAGLLVPLFSIPSSRSWGIGEIADLPQLARWCLGAGCRLIQLLPVTEMPPGETSPYSSLSAMAIDPQFISMADVPEFAEFGGEAALEPSLQQQLATLRQAMRVDYPGVRALKDVVLRRCFARFRTVHQGPSSFRAQAFQRFAAAEAWWLDDYATFRAVHAAEGEHSWQQWPDGLRDRDGAALARAAHHMADEIDYRKYQQWIAAAQWNDAREACGDVQLFGDLPFMVGGDSADVWSRADEFRLDVSVGVPPDAFSDTGQDWRLPLYRWDVLASRDFDWLRLRARRYAALYDGYRVDHLVGFYRTFFRPLDGSTPEFSPARQGDQERLGEQVLGALLDEGAGIIAEDLGLVPDFVRASLDRLGVPGYKVFRWEREWSLEGQPFIDPVAYPQVSVATSGTHDTEPLTVWWEQASDQERDAVRAVPSIHRILSDHGRPAQPSDPHLPELAAVLEALFASGSDYLILPIGDVFGWRDRINQPATISLDNWTWRLPWPVERLQVQPHAAAVASIMAGWSARYRRTPAVAERG